MVWLYHVLLPYGCGPLPNLLENKVVDRDDDSCAHGVRDHNHLGDVHEPLGMTPSTMQE